MGTDAEPRIKRNAGRSSKTSSRDFGPRVRAKVSWGEVDNQLIRDAIVAVTDAGAAIMLGVTSEKGAYSITVLDGDNKVREWPHTVEELEDTLKWLVDMFPDS